MCVFAPEFAAALNSMCPGLWFIRFLFIWFQNKQKSNVCTLQVYVVGELGLNQMAVVATDGLSGAEGLAWRASFDAFFQVISGHMAALAELYKHATAQGIHEAADYTRGIVPVNVIRATLPHANEAQRDNMRRYLQELG